VAQVIAQLPAVVEGLTGVQLRELIKAVPGLAVDGTETENVEAEVQQ
jgi:hypothetical protein